MKKVTLILSMVFAVIAMSAQTIVSTTAENKNVVLEEFTGIHCTYCPAGHLISNNIATANPGDFFAINVHTGSFATPSGSEPNFKTTYGDAIAGQSGLTGYPAGTVNRHLFSGYQQGSGTAQSRGDWTATTALALAEASYVNIAATSSLNLSTRVMDILVEVYVTGTAPATMALNVAVLQNNVEGPQTGMSSNPDQVLPNGNYNHNHMLRDLVTGQWGETIATAGGAGTFISKTYQYTVPADVNGVAMELADLELIVFLAEGNQEIITGNESVMSYVTPPGIDVCDLSAENMTVLPALCGTSVTPMIKVTNNSTTITADTFNVKYSMNGGTEVVQTIYTPLAPGANTTITFTAENLTAASNNIEFNVNFDGVVHLIDMPAGNNNATTGIFYTMPATTIGTVYSEDFEGLAGMTDVPNTIISNPSGSAALVLSKDQVTGLTNDIGGFGNSESSYFVNFYGIAAGNEINMMFHKMDFSNNTGYGLKFNYAYAQYSSENDKLDIEVSTDCGATWTNVWSKQGAGLATAPANSSGNFFPAVDQWKSANIDLSAYNSTADVMIAFKATSAYGNNLFFDDVSVYNSTNVSIETVENSNSVNVYPNPANSQFNLALDLSENATVNYTVLNNLGQTVLSADLGNLNAGNQNETVNISNLANGVYVIQININNTIITKKLTVK